ncbi:unnamed protein product [Pleuronectes platessa]|uniref:Uncharacterized protein n=1 Tax=Pleuronectes platessa TaxID=8262 RepID=A0A9N7Z5R3_PLEPL|nr:unnamed protein product [Pleuronectes platessa]
MDGCCGASSQFCPCLLGGMASAELSLMRQKAIERMPVEEQKGKQWTEERNMACDMKEDNSITTEWISWGMIQEEPHYHAAKGPDPGFFCLTFFNMGNVHISRDLSMAFGQKLFTSESYPDSVH